MAKQTKAADDKPTAADEQRAEAEGRQMAELARQRQQEEAEESALVVEELKRREDKTREMLAAARKARREAEG